MKTSSIITSITSLATAFTTTVHGLPQKSDNDSGLPVGYSLTDVTWIGNITENGPDMSFTGPNMKDIEAQILRINPSFKWTGNGNSTSSNLARRGKDWLTCDPNNIWWAQAFRIAEGIDYLKQFHGTCHIGPGPRVCSRISCSYKSAIWWCNDQKTDLYIDCSIWTEYAQIILDNCQTRDESVRVRGQQFDNDDFNIMVGFSGDHC